jgi:hypothetical protein
MGFYDAFFGSSQSQYTAYAIITAIIAICITILLTATDIPISNRILIVFFVIISLVPSIFLTLFELTCIVTGGTEPNRWWCYSFAWILAAFIIIYCVFIVIISLISLFTYNNAIDNINNDEKNNKLSKEDTNEYAKTIIVQSENKQKELERFYLENEFKYSAGANAGNALGNAVGGFEFKAGINPTGENKVYVDVNANVDVNRANGAAVANGAVADVGYDNTGSYAPYIKSPTNEVATSYTSRTAPVPISGPSVILSQTDTGSFDAGHPMYQSQQSPLPQQPQLISPTPMVSSASVSKFTTLDENTAAQNEDYFYNFDKFK